MPKRRTELGAGIDGDLRGAVVGGDRHAKGIEYQVEFSIQPQFAREGNQAVTDHEIQREVLVRIGVVDLNGFNVEAFKAVVGTEELEDLRRGAVGTKIENDGLDTESHPSGRVNGQRRHHGRKLAFGKVVRGVKTRIAPSEYLEHGRLREILNLRVLEKNLGQKNLNVGMRWRSRIS